MVCAMDDVVLQRERKWFKGSAIGIMPDLRNLPDALQYLFRAQDLFQMF